MTHDPTRDCEHGRLKGKCDVCDLQAEVERLKANIALDKKAENARELGLSYEPAPVQEPVATKPWVDLTDEEIMAAPENLIACIAYVRNKLREKNNITKGQP
jgi:hypothetical protein